ncbi:MAG: exodeoxyribonuclease VII large subunit [Clostridia bacterium]|nr:exodeoxyribonuclease VII large subunit [Clostridia bacterium]
MQTVTVKQLNLFVKSLIEGEARLNDIYVTGEISNFKNHYASGHLYFTLKDNDASIRCVMFKGYASRLKFAVVDGLKVIIRGRVSIYEKDGQYQFYAEEMYPDGLGDISLQFEQIKERLKSEGLFDSENKRPIPKFPKSIAIITSETGAAVQDILNILTRRYPLTEIVLCPVSVQGENAVPEMLDALERVYSLSRCDLIIIGRGGGSIEDLWAFNSEILARKIFESPIPVISAVGHETDFTICDFVADLRAPTPSAAAELAVPDVIDIKNQISAYSRNLKSALQDKLNSLKLRYTAVMNSPYLKNAERSIIYSRRQNIDILTDNLLNRYNTLVNHYSARLKQNVASLDALSPLKVLSRGYSVAEINGKVLKSVKNANVGDKLTLKLSDGSLLCTVDSQGDNNGK